ncbi:MAG: hypothetical protein PW788_02580 [Micavibrio sp.]|nr:hypothetical protein [Micavibrio sp.]
MSILDSLFGPAGQLGHEKHKAILKGPTDDIARLKKLDKAIGSLMKPFNGVARVPAEVATKIDALIRDNALSISRVVAVRPYEENALESIGTWVRGAQKATEQPLDWLEYENVYRSPNGNRIEQRVAQFKVGP